MLSPAVDPYGDAVNPRELTQFVAFTSALSEDVFLQRWRPIAGSFLRQGLTSITLAAVTDPSDSSGHAVSYVSRNTWPSAAYRAAFPGGLATEAAYGGVTVTQPGVFRSLRAEPKESVPRDQDLVLAFITLGGAPLVADVAVDLEDRLAQRVPEGTAVTVYVRDVPGGLQRVDLVVRVSTAPGGAERLRDVVGAAVRDGVTPAALVLLAGREFLALSDGDLGDAA